METQETVCQKAYRLLKTVPSKKFIVGCFTDKRSKCCVIGHYTRLTSKNPDDYSPRNCDDDFHSDLREEFRKIEMDLEAINDGDSFYEKDKLFLKFKTPKGRSMSALRFAIKQGK